MIFKVDDVTHYTYNPPVKDASTWPFDLDQYLLLNIAIQQNIFPGFTQGAMEIDYVRVYQESPLANGSVENSINQLFYPNPVDDELNIVVPNEGEQNVSLKVYRMDGQVVKSYVQSVKNTTITLKNLENLSSGMYVVVYTLDERNYSFKFVKN